MDADEPHRARAQERWTTALTATRAAHATATVFVAPAYWAQAIGNTAPAVLLTAGAVLTMTETTLNLISTIRQR